MTLVPSGLPLVHVRSATPLGVVNKSVERKQCYETHRVVYALEGENRFLLGGFLVIAPGSSSLGSAGARLETTVSSGVDASGSENAGAVVVAGPSVAGLDVLAGAGSPWGS